LSLSWSYVQFIELYFL
jgi:hypothetical protein